MKQVTQFFIYFALFIFALTLLHRVHAHGSGPPFVKINEEYMPTNPLTTYTFPESFEIGSDIATSSAYLVGNTLTFEIDLNNFENPYTFETDRNGMMRRMPESMIPQPVFRWDFRDNTPPVEGLKAEHVFKKVGTYIVDIQVKYPEKNNTFGSINSVQLNILPSAGYSLPQAKIKVDNKTISNPEMDTVEIVIGKTYSFDASDSTGKIKQYIWDFNDGTVQYGPTIKHKFTDEDLIAIYPTLRVIDENDIVSDTYVSLDVVENANFFITLIDRIKSFFSRN